MKRLCGLHGIMSNHNDDIYSEWKHAACDYSLFTQCLFNSNKANMISKKVKNL